MTEPSEIAYLPATPALRPAIVDLLRGCSLPVEDLPGALEHFVVASAGDHLVGSAGLELLGDVALFRSLAVAPSWRGRGLARRLFEETRSRARALRARSLYLLTTSAQDVFAHWGFVTVPREQAPPAVQGTAQYRTLCAASAVVMRLDLLGDQARR
jgi:amino-acid N-acetyltransferase